MTPEQRAAARERCNMATGGPWGLSGSTHWPNRQGAIKAVWGHAKCRAHQPRICCIDRPRKAIGDANAEFIAHARTDLPDALDALDAAEARAEDAERRVKELQGMIGKMLPLGWPDTAAAVKAVVSVCASDDGAIVCRMLHQHEIERQYKNAALVQTRQYCDTLERIVAANCDPADATPSDSAVIEAIICKARGD